MYKLCIRPLLFLGDAEKSHLLASRIAETIQKSSLLLHLITRRYRVVNPRLQTTVAGITFSNPVGLAAGFDKYASMVPFLTALGFGFIEIGTITAQPQLGNPTPRLFRLPADKALINRMGFNNAGAVAASRVLTQLHRKGRTKVPLGINIGKSKVTPLSEAASDYLSSFRILYQFADYFVVNVSSPNTPGLRSLQEKPILKKLLLLLQQENTQQKPIFFKLAPDLTMSQLDDALVVAVETKVAGIILVNTTISREGLRTKIEEQGGLSGLPLHDRSTEMIRYVYQKTNGSLPIIGVGGVFTASQAYAKIKAGASLVQVFTGLIYEGPGIVREINKGLLRCLRKDGFTSITEAVGAEHCR